MGIWPKGRAPAMVAPHFVWGRRPDLTLCEELRNNITLDFGVSQALSSSHLGRPRCFHYTLLECMGSAAGHQGFHKPPKQEWQKFDF